MTDNTEFVLTADDVKAIKQAHAVVPFYRPAGEEGPVWGIRLGREIRLDYVNADRQLAMIARDKVWTRVYVGEDKIDYSRTLSADPAFSQVVLHDQKNGPAREAVAVTYRSEPHVQSALAIIRAGDSIGVHFVGSNNHDYLRNAQLHADECYLRVVRKGKLVGEYLLDVSVTPDNSARMVRS